MSKSIFSKFGTDANKETAGVWVEFFAGGDTIRVKIARAGGSNAAFTKLANELAKPYRRGNVNPADIPAAVENALNARLYATAVVLDWEGVCGNDEQPIPYTVETGIEVFKGAPVFLEFVMQEASNFKNFNIAAREDEVKN
jgi:hypothetical protein